jgi:hypothetical protein
MSWRTLPSSASRLPNATRVSERSMCASRQRDATPIGAHAVVQPARAEATLRNLKAAILAEENVLRQARVHW